MNVLHVHMRIFLYLRAIRPKYEKPFTARPQFSAVYTTHIQCAAAQSAAAQTVEKVRNRTNVRRRNMIQCRAAKRPLPRVRSQTSSAAAKPAVSAVKMPMQSSGGRTVESFQPPTPSAMP